MYGSGTTTLIISNEEMNDIMKIIKSIEESGLLIKVSSETVKDEAKDQKGGFLSMLLGTLGASLLGDLLAVKGAVATRQGYEWSDTLPMQANMPGRDRTRAGEGAIRNTKILLK